MVNGEVVFARKSRLVGPQSSGYATFGDVRCVGYQAGADVVG